MSNLNLLGTMSHVEIPFIKVTIGEYTFGAYDKISSRGIDVYGAYKLNRIKYPNYIRSLEVTKINGQVNKYELNFEYTITEEDDPNFFEKVFSSVSKSRKIVFSYGDLSAPSYIYKEEEALILSVRSDFAIASSKIIYRVSAVSASQLMTVGAYTFREFTEQPSVVIENLLYNESYGLLELFPGMRDRETVKQLGLIPHNDVKKNLEMQSNISIFEYLMYLVNNMTPVTKNSTTSKSTYILTIVDDTKGILPGSYFKIVQTDSAIINSDAYEIDIGYPSQNVVMEFHVENDESYAIYHDYQTNLNGAEYVQRINNRGEIQEVYAPVISSGNAQYQTEEQDVTWWSKVTSYPVKCSIKLKGLLRPAILMTHVRLNVYFFGRKHISSGLYLVTKQVDSIDESGFKTVLNLIRIPNS